MKTETPIVLITRRLPRIAALVFLILGVTLIGCSTTVQTRPMTQETETSSPPPPSLATPATVRGIPYFLPTFALDLSLESLKDDKGNHKDLQVKNTVRFVPDPTRGYLLDSRDRWHSRKTHHVKLKDGMLSLVTTEDENKLGEILADLAGSAANVVAFGAFDSAAPAAEVLGMEENGAVPTIVPTPEEIAEILAMIPAGAFEFSFPETPSGPIDVPGTEGLLVFTFGYASVASSISTVEPDARNDHGEIGIRAPNPRGGEGGFSGIYTRVLRPQSLTIEFQIPKAKLLLFRLSMLASKIVEVRASLDEQTNALSKLCVSLEEKQRIKGALEEQSKTLTDLIQKLTDQLALRQAGSPEQLALTRQISETRLMLTEILERIDTVRGAITALEATAAEAEKAKAKLTAALERKDTDDSRLAVDDGLIEQARYWASIQATKPPAPNDYAKVAQRSSTILVPDKDLTVQIPVTRTWFGIAKNSLTLESGVLTEYRTEKDSAGLAAVKVIYSLTERIVELPAKILQLRIDYSTKQKALADAERAYAELKAEIAKSKDPASDHTKDVQELTMEKEILTLQKEIAELRAAIEKANKDT